MTRVPDTSPLNTDQRHARMSGEFVTRSDAACPKCGGWTCRIAGEEDVKRYWSGGTAVDAACTNCGAAVQTTR